MLISSLLDRQAAGDVSPKPSSRPQLFFLPGLTITFLSFGASLLLLVPVHGA